MKNLVIITGTSRGLGLHLAEYFLDAGYSVVGLGRTNQIKNERFYFLKTDLTQEKKIGARLDAFLKKKKIALKNTHVALINNAATIAPIHYLHKTKKEEILPATNLNLVNPILLCHFTIGKFLASSAQLTICNVSSGAALRPLANWSIYCSMKSGLKMFTDCLNVDYAESNNLKAFSFYPGVMDTKMQDTIRKQKSENFKNIENFKSLKKENNLLDPKMVAYALFNLMSNPQKIKKADYDIKEIQP